MVVEIREKNLVFSFNSVAIKYDSSQYYRQHFGKIQNVSAVDILAIEKNAESSMTFGYLIEIKDFTHPDSNEKSMNVFIDNIVKKIISTLSAILPMKINAKEPSEQHLATLFSQVDKIKVFLHIELSPNHPIMARSIWNHQNIEMALARKLKAIDTEPKVVDSRCPNLFWRVHVQQEVVSTNTIER